MPDVQTPASSEARGHRNITVRSSAYAQRPLSKRRPEQPCETPDRTYAWSRCRSHSAFGKTHRPRLRWRSSKLRPDGCSTESDLRTLGSHSDHLGAGLLRVGNPSLL